MIIDMEAIVAAYEHGLVFCAEDINHLFATALSIKGFWTAWSRRNHTKAL